MGTNFYVKYNHKKDTLKDEIQSLLDKNDFFGIQSLLNENLEEIHIAKRSGGWQFLFESNKHLYPDTKQGVEQFLKENEESLYDESGDKLSCEEFWDSFEKCRNGHDGKSYDKEHPNEYPRVSSYEYKSKDGENLRFSKGEFC